MGNGMVVEKTQNKFQSAPSQYSFLYFEDTILGKFKFKNKVLNMGNGKALKKTRTSFIKEQKK
jgi:hypothetical protein